LTCRKTRRGACVYRGGMVTSLAAATCARRRLLLAAAALSLPLSSLAGVVFTPRELKDQYARDVRQRLHVPADEVRLYGSIAEAKLCNLGHEVLEPQYLLVIDRNPCVQAGFLFWRLLPGSYDLIGASPVSAGALRLDRVRDAQALFAQVNGATGRGRRRVFDFGWQGGEGLAPPDAHCRLQVRAAGGGAERRLGAPCPDSCILLPASLIGFLDEYGVLDEGAGGRTQRHLLPYRGHHLLIVDSERDERPAWSPAPPGAAQFARAPRRHPPL
jgi:hypothetical protein